MNRLHALPPGLPRPVDDGACRRLAGMAMPNVCLSSTSGRFVDVGALGPGRTIILAIRLTTALNLPTFDMDGMRLIKRLTLVVSDGVIEHVFYPVFPPDQHASHVVRWLRSKPAR